VGFFRHRRVKFKLAARASTGRPDNIGIVFQSPVLLAWRTVSRQRFAADRHAAAPRRDYVDKARALLGHDGSR
jgi:ABC-type nitrate/sulfonate/bicarbonate transport system ATPase subunit